MRRNNNECVYRFLNTNGSLAPFPLLEPLTIIWRNLRPKFIRKIVLQRLGVGVGGFLDYTQGNVLTNNYWAARSGWAKKSRFFWASLRWMEFRLHVIHIKPNLKKLKVWGFKKLKDYNNHSGSSPCMTPIDQQWPLNTFLRTLRCSGNTARRDYQDFYFFFTEVNQFLVINVPGNLGGRETNISFTVVMKVKLDF